jgi:antitoxin (DNA-binding transcriptional repressor) of toxin-antitoxin stability system
MKTIGAKELRLRMSDVLDCVGRGEEIIVTHRFKAPVRIVAVSSQESRYTGDKVGKRLDALLKDLPHSISPMLRDPGKSYKQLRDELYRRDPKYRRYLSPHSIDE